MLNSDDKQGSGLARPSGQYQIPAISRAAAVFDALARSGKPLRLSELSNELKIPRASLFSILATLVEERLLERDGMYYRFGERLALLARSADAGGQLTRVSRPILARLVAKVSESAQVAVLDQDVAHYVDALEGTQTLRVATWVGKRNPLDRTAIGQALLLEMTTDGLRPLLPELDVKGLAVLEERLVLARERGFTTDEGLGEPGVYCIGAPIRDASGSIIAALSVSAPDAHLTVGRRDGLAALVVATAAEISAGCGWSRVEA